MILLGLTGPRQSGKSTAAAYLRVHHRAVELAFADPLYQALSCAVMKSPRFQHLPILQLLPAVKDWANDPAVKEHPQPELNGMSPREFLNAEGDHLLTMFGTGYLIQRVREQLESLQKNARLMVVISDVRDDREAAFVRGFSGTLYHLNRASAQHTGEHRTDCGVSFMLHDHLLHNNGPSAQLHMQLDRIAAELKAEYDALARGRA